MLHARESGGWGQGLVPAARPAPPPARARGNAVGLYTATVAKIGRAHV